MKDKQLARELVRNWHQVVSFIYGLARDIDTAEEVFQEVTLAVLTESASCDEVRRFLPWVREVARRRLVEHYRRRARDRELTGSWARLADAASRGFDENPESPEAGRRRMAALKECIDRLPERSREVVQHRYISRLSLGDVARAMALRLSSARALLSRARKALAECVRLKLGSKEVA